MSSIPLTSPFDQAEIEELRKLFPHTSEERLYLNHAAIGPLSIKVVEAIQKRLKLRSTGSIDTFDRDAAVAEMVRRYMANLINAPTEDRIAFVSNTSEGLNLVASGLGWQEGDHILINDMEFPSNVYPYKNLEQYGVDVEKISTTGGKITVDQVAKSIRPSTKLVAISAVQFLSGYRGDLEAIGKLCKEHNCWFVVDAIQALGAVPIDVQTCNIDALVAGSHKWLMAPQGIASLYVTEQLQEAIQNHYVGWLSVEEPWLLFETDQDLDPTARRYELGTPNFNGLHGLNASLETFYDVGPNRVTGQINLLTSKLIETFRTWEATELLTPSDWNERAGIVTIKLPDRIDNSAFMDQLKKQKVSVALREGYLRIAPHYYNTMEEIDQAIGVIDKAMRKD